MMKKILIVMLMILTSVHLFDVQANTNVFSQLPEAIQQRLHESLNSQGDNTITKTQLTASDGAFFDKFGYAVALDGTTLVVSAMEDSYDGINYVGSVYVYDLEKSPGHPDFERKITPSDGEEGDSFGKSIAINGTTLAVGSYYDDDKGSNSGSVYVYDLTLDGNAETTENPATPYATGFERKITVSNGSSNDQFGYSVALDGTTLVVGAILDDDNMDDTGSVYVFDLSKSNEDDQFMRKIKAPDWGGGDWFGYSVALDGTTLVVGATRDDDKGSASGSVYVYNLNMVNGQDEFVRKIIASDGEASDKFGNAVALDGTALVVSAQEDKINGTRQGSVYVYDLTLDGSAFIDDRPGQASIPSIPYESGFERKIIASDGESSDEFGSSVAINGTTLVVGALGEGGNSDTNINSGSVYIYDLTLDGNAETAENAATPYADGFELKMNESEGQASDQYGSSVALDGSNLIVGVRFDDDKGANSGSVYIYNGTFGSGTTKTDEEWASEITTMIELLTEPYVRADVEAARTAYDALTPEQQALVTNYQTLLNAEQALADQDAAAAVDAMIDALTNPYDIDAIDDARDAYENLTEAQKALVTGLSDLEAAEQRYADIDAASIVDGMIAALSEPYDAVAVYDARLAYDALTETQKGYVTRLPELEAAEQAVADQTAAAAVDALIDALTSPYVRADVEAARTAYDALTETQKQLVTGVPDLEAAEAGLVDQALAQAVELLINTLTTPYDSDAVQTARDAYDALTEAQQALVTNYQALIDAEQAIDDQVAAAAVDVLIDALSAPYDPESVQAAREAYENLTDEQQILVTGLLDLETAEDTLMNETEAAGVDALIQTLTEESTEEEVDAVREAYESLTEEQKTLVTQLPTLITYEQQFASPDSTGLVLFMIFFIGVISAVIYFAFYKRNNEKDEKKINE